MTETVHRRLQARSWLAARTILVEMPEYPGRPNSAVTPAREDWQKRLMDQWPTLREVDGVLVNGLIALTWENDDATDGELVRRSTRIINAILPRRFEVAP